MANAPEPPRSRSRARAAGTRSAGSRSAGNSRSASPRAAGPRSNGPREREITSRKQNPLVSAAQILLGITLSCSIALVCFMVLAGLAFVVYEYILK